MRHSGRLGLGCFSAGLIACLFASCQGASQDRPGTTPIAKSRGVAALGRFEPRDRVIDISVAGDQRLARILVMQGQSVKAGDILAYLESFNRRTAARDQAVASLADAETRLRADTEQAQARIQEANLRLRQTKEVPAAEIQAQEARIRETQSDLDLAIRNLGRIRALLESNVIARQEFDRQSSQVDHLRASLESEQATLRRISKTTDTDREIAEAQLATRKMELDSIRASAQVASVKQTVRVAEAELNESIVRAPSDGQIIEVIGNPGESVLGKVILRMGDVSQMYALCEVYETDVPRIRLGQDVQVSSAALSKTLTGKVERIGTNVFKRQVRSLDPQADVDARVIQVRVRMDESDEAGRFVGLQVDVLINTVDQD